MGRAGAEKSMLELINTLDKDKYEIHLFSLINRGEMFDYVPPHVRIHNKKPDSRSVLGAKSFLFKTILRAMFKGFNLIGSFPYIVRNLADQLKNKRLQFDKIFWKLISDGASTIDEKFDVAIAYLEGGASLYVANHVNADKKAAFIHIDYKQAGYSKKLDNGCYNKMDKIYIVSEEAKRSFLDIYPELLNKVQIFYNIINKSSIMKLAGEGNGFRDAFEGFRLLTIGRLHYQKGYDIVIPALARLINENYKVKWYVLGEGEIRYELEKLIEKYQLEDKFILLGAVANPYTYLKQCDLYVHATRFEGRSIAIDEAQVLGKAIIASDSSGNREQIVDGVNGLIVKLDEKEIAEAIKKLLDDKFLRNKFEQTNGERAFNYRDNMKSFYDFLGDAKNEGYTDNHTCI